MAIRPVDEIANAPLLSLEQLRARLRQVGEERYHHRHPFHQMMHEGRLTRGQLQAWALNRYYYQSCIPIKDAIIVRGDKPSFISTPSQFPTDADGQFRLPPLRPRETTLTVIASGWAPQLRRVKLQEGLPPQDFRMEPGKPIQLRIVDGAGKPIPNACVSSIEWKGANSLSPNSPKLPKGDAKIPPRADGDGIWKWTWAPGETVKLQIYANGFAASELEIAGGASVRTVTLNAKPRGTDR